MDEFGIDDPTNIAGMSLLIDRSNMKTGFNVMDLEQQIMNTSNLQFKHKQAQQPVSYTSDVDRLADSLRTPRRVTTFRDTGDTDCDKLQNDLDDIDAGLGDEYNFAGASGAASVLGAGTSTTDARSDTARSFADFTASDPHLETLTVEERKQNVIGQVFNDYSDNHSPIIGIEHEKEQDEKARKLEQISFVTSALEEESEDLSRIPRVDYNNSMGEIDAVLKVLVLKNDRKRCAGMAEESILLFAHGLEFMFDGQKTYMTMRPNLGGWHKSVAVKLRRMRADTSQIVSSIMHNHGVGPVTRLLLELVPSAVLYSRMKRAQHDDNLIPSTSYASESSYDDALNQIRDLS